MDFSKLCMLPHEVDIVIYHGRCSDGFGSALAVYTYFKDQYGININGNKIEYYPASFNTAPPDVSNKNVLICDFSYNYEITCEMLTKAKKLVILDHHKSAKEALDQISDTNKFFTMEHSGAYITWKYFYPDPNAIVPDAILYIEDNDIWKKELPNTRDVTAYIFSLPFEFEDYSKLLEPNHIQTVAIPVGSGMMLQNNVYIKQGVTHGINKFMLINEKYYMVTHVNSTILKSEIGNECLFKYKNTNFSAIYSVSDPDYWFSLRSENERTDVSAIATKFGGGGHRNAAGLTSTKSIIPGKLIDDYNLYNQLNNIYFDKMIYLDKCYNVVYLNYTTNKHHVAKYLLQERYSDSTNRSIQECCSIHRNRTNDKEYYEQFEISIVWSYDCYAKKQWISLAYKCNTIKDMIKLKLSDDSKYDDYYEGNQYIVFSKYCENLQADMTLH